MFKFRNNFFRNYSKNLEYPCSRNTLSDNFTMLMFMIINMTDIDIIADYVSKNRNQVNKQNNKGWTALMIACCSSNIYGNDTVELLLQNNADANMKNNNLQTALTLSIINNNTNSNIETIMILLNYLAYINPQDIEKNTPLMYVCKNYNLELVKLLLDHKANVDILDIDRNSPLMIACKDCNVELAKLLINNKANIHFKNLLGLNALTICTYNRVENLEIINMIQTIENKTFVQDKLFVNDITDDQEIIDIDNLPECIICFEPYKIKCVLNPCGHTGICHRCIPLIKHKCPVCREKFINAIRLFDL